MKKVKCRRCGFNNPANLEKCLSCEASLDLDFGQMVAERILPLFSSKKQDIPAATSVLQIDENNLLQFVSNKNETYILLKPLGQGGYCNVYLVEDEKNKNLYAIKLLRFWEINQKDREDVETRFWFEFQMAHTKSEYLVTAFDKGLVSGNPFYVMEYCEGGALTKQIGSHLSNIRLIYIASDILKGLRDIHNENAVHRDLKPNNVVFNNGRAKLIDFGISGRNNIRMTRKNEVLGTDVYMAPEWFDSEKKEFFTKRPTVDIFSFGVLIFEIITGGYFPYGNPPDSTSNFNDYHNKLGEYFQKVLNNLWDNLNYFKENGTITPFWEKIIEKCLAADPTQRYQNSSEILAVLNSFEIDKYCSNCDVEIFHKRELLCQNCGYYLLNGTMGLRVVVGKDTNQYFNLTEIIAKKGIATLGRKSSLEIQDNDIAIADFETMLTLSRYHATIEFSTKTGMWFIRDGQWRENNHGQHVWNLSKNGIYINSTKVDSMGLAIFPNDIIAIGNTTLRVEFIPDTAL